MLIALDEHATQSREHGTRGWRRLLVGDLNETSDGCAAPVDKQQQPGPPDDLLGFRIWRTFQTTKPCQATSDRTF